MASAVRLGVRVRRNGCDKSGLGARLALFETLGPCRFAGWGEGGECYRFFGCSYRYSRGEPMGRPGQSPYIRLMATEEMQTGNVYDAVHYNLVQEQLAEVPGLIRLLLPPVPASSSSPTIGPDWWRHGAHASGRYRPEL